MLNKKKIAILGAGNMGDALVSGLIGSKSSAPKNIICTDVRQSKLDEIKSKYVRKQIQSYPGFIPQQEIQISSNLPMFHNIV